MLRVGVVISDYKFKVFQRHLTRAGLKFEKEPATAGTLLLLVDVPLDEVGNLRGILAAANTEAAIFTADSNGKLH